MTRIRRYVLALVFACSAGLLAQDAPKQASTPVVPSAASVTVAELISAYRHTWTIARQRVTDQETRLVATPEYKAFEEVRQQLLKLEADLSAKITAKTGKTIVWATGELK